MEETNLTLFCSKTFEQWYKVRRYEIVDIELEIFFGRSTLGMWIFQISNLIGKTYREAALPNNNPPIPKPNAIGNQADRIGVKTAFTPIELVMKENT